MPSSTEDAIQSLIREQGRITFAQFMSLALFYPYGGYYTSGERIGAQGDFYTSPSAHPTFGALLCLQLKQMWQLLGQPMPFYVVELGAGSGLLAQDILAYSESLGDDFRRSLSYLALDQQPSTTAREQPEVRIPQRLMSEGVPLTGVVGCFLSNELVDAFPVHRFQIMDGKPQEVYVTYQGGQYTEVMDNPSTPLIEERLNTLEVPLAEGFRGEVNLALSQWMQGVSGALGKGFVVTIDYGHSAKELYSRARAIGTLQCYYKHTSGGSPYQRIGRQDITAHVDFTSLVRTGEEHGLTTLGMVPQGVFLQNLGAASFVAALRTRFRDLSQREYYANRMGILELIKTGGLGDFKVLVQARGVEGVDLHGLTPDNPLLRQMEEDLAQLDVPLLGQRHTPLMEGRYPHVG